MPGSKGPGKPVSEMTRGELIIHLIVFTIIPVLIITANAIQWRQSGLSLFNFLGIAIPVTVLLSAHKLLFGELRRRGQN